MFWVFFVFIDLFCCVVEVGLYDILKFYNMRGNFVNILLVFLENILGICYKLEVVVVNCVSCGFCGNFFFIFNCFNCYGC